jgi:transcriptional regulator with XRE-family HTH domain
MNRSVSANTNSNPVSRPTHFGPLLKSWRGLRRVSQLELALRTDISQRHLSFLESGRARPSRDMVLRLAETLDVPLRERNTLLGSAGYAPLYSESGLDQPYLAQARQALELTLRHHEPYPALVLDQHWRMLMSNQAAQRMFGWFLDREMLTAGQTEEPPNALTLTFHPHGLWQYVRNKDEVGPAIIDRVRREALAGAHGEHSERLLADALRQAGIDPHWRRYEFVAPPAPLVVLELAKNDLLLRLFSMIATFGTPQDVTLQELRLETFFPADAATEALLRQSANPGVST